MRRSVPPIVLTIAGSDSGAGAGIQADARTIEALSGFACTAITAITAQNPRGVRAWRPVAERLVAEQIAAVLEAMPVAAIKTGLLPGARTVKAIADVLARAGAIPLVVDPVIGSTSGTRFLDAAGVRALRRELLPRAILVTPNWPEAEALTGRSIASYADAEDAARALATAAGCAVLLKGGHARDRRESRDVLVTRDGDVRWYRSRRIATRNTHGTGCVLSAAIATRLAQGASLERAVGDAHDFLHAALRAGRGVSWGPGHGPALVPRAR